MSQPPSAKRPLTEAQARSLSRSPRQSFRHGIIHSLPFLLVVMPFAMLFGLIATEAGLDIAQVMGFSALVLAGASQFTAIQLLTDHAPVWLVLVSALAVNLRMAMYSASLVPWLGQVSPLGRASVAFLLIDQTYAVSIAHFQNNPKLGLAQRMAYFLGTALTLCLPWVVFTYLGAVFGRAIPESWALDFAVPITFLAMIAPALRTAAHVTAATVSVILALVFAGLPSGVGLLIAAPAAMTAGAWVETIMIKRNGGERT